MLLLNNDWPDISFVFVFSIAFMCSCDLRLYVWLRNISGGQESGWTFLWFLWFLWQFGEIPPRRSTLLTTRKSHKQGHNSTQKIPLNDKFSMNTLLDQKEKKRSLKYGKTGLAWQEIRPIEKSEEKTLENLFD